MHIVLTRLEVRPERREAFLALARELVRDAARDWPGTLAVTIAQDAAAPERFYVCETFRDEAAYQAAVQGPAFQAGMARVGPLLAAIPVVLGEGIVVAESAGRGGAG